MEKSLLSLPWSSNVWQAIVGGQGSERHRSERFEEEFRCQSNDGSTPSPCLPPQLLSCFQADTSPQITNYPVTEFAQTKRSGAVDWSLALEGMALFSFIFVGGASQPEVQPVDCGLVVTLIGYL